jgi:uncharacterized protein (DUF1015 family)
MIANLTGVSRIIMPPMPELRPFRGVRYSPLGPLRDLVCPPYDVISPSEQVRLHERHPYNAVRIELPFSDSNEPMERYRSAAKQFRNWLETGVLVTDDAPSMYVYRQDYVAPDGTRGTVAGVIGALDLEEFGENSGVLPHERTMPGPIEDRLMLLRACPVNISPIYGIYRGRGSLSPYFDSLTHRPPDARFSDENGILHRLWAIRAPAEIDMLQDALRSSSIVIADGHHRYETALAYHAEQDGAPGGHDAVMCFCVDADAEGLVVFPYHRVLRTGVGTEEIKERVSSLWGGRPVGAEKAADELARSTQDHPIALVTGDEYLLIEVSHHEVAERLKARSDEWRSLDVVALHEVVLPSLFPEGIHDIAFSTDPIEVDRLVKEEGWSVGVLLRPPAAADVIDVARSGERMPQKASYFWPKAVTGLVFRTLR